jgi:hypothetical protein
MAAYGPRKQECQLVHIGIRKARLQRRLQAARLLSFTGAVKKKESPQIWMSRQGVKLG